MFYTAIGEELFAQLENMILNTSFYFFFPSSFFLIIRSRSAGGWEYPSTVKGENGTMFTEDKQIGEVDTVNQAGKKPGELSRVR